MKERNWVQTGLLNGINEGYKQSAMISCLNKQLDFNEEYEDPTFMRCSIPLVRRVFAESNHVFISESNSEFCNYLFFKTPWSPPTNSSRSLNNLEEETKYLTSLSESLLNEINETFKDLRATEINFQGFGMSESKIFMLYT